jgi:5-methylcytosine-specific restriction endonuclease McrA
MGEAGERRVSDKPIPRRLRFEILRRDGHTCRYCGAQAPDVPLTVDETAHRWAEALEHAAELRRKEFGD